MILNELEESKGGAGYDTGYVDPFLGIKKIISMNYNPQMDDKTFKGDQKKTKKEKQEQDALDKKITEFKEHKLLIPKPVVKHGKNPLALRDIIISNYSLAIGGKTLLETTTLKLTKGRRYGLIGRNGVGKTTLLNEIVRKDIPDFPKDIHVAIVEQEVEGSSMSVLETVLICDEERNALLKELAEIEAIVANPDEKETRKGMQAAKRLEEVIKRLVFIYEKKL